MSWNLQGFYEQEDEGDGGVGAELRQLQPAAVEGAARRAQQLRWALSDAEQLGGENNEDEDGCMQLYLAKSINV